MDDLNLPNDIHQMENEAIDEDEEKSESFSIEFASNSKSGGTMINGYIGHDTSASQSIVFADSIGISESPVCTCVRAPVDPLPSDWQGGGGGR